MIWIIRGNESHGIISCNVANKEDNAELWVTRPNGKNLKIFEDKNKELVREMKDAIDFAIKVGEKTFTIE